METPITTTNTITEHLSSLVSPAELNSFLMNLYTTFLNVHGKRFAKPYTPAQLIKATKHIVQCTAPSDDAEEMEWTIRVKQIEVRNGAFYLVWSGEGRDLQIQLTDEPEDKLSQQGSATSGELPPQGSATSGELPPQGSATSGEHSPQGSATSGELPPQGSVAFGGPEQTPDKNGSLEELNVNELPMSDPSTFRLSPPHDDAASDTRAEERRAVEAARVFAQLAHYKAQKAIAKYVKKYGELDDFLSDSSDESDLDD